MRRYAHAIGLSRANARRNRMALARATVLPAITGTFAAAQILTAVPGNWPPAGAVVTYQWFLDMVPIPGAAAATYTVTTNDAGRALGCQITSTDPVFGVLSVGIQALR